MRWCVALIAFFVGLSAAPRFAVAAGEIVVLRLDGAVQPASLRYLERGLEGAADRGAELVVLELDTPGGTLVSLRRMTTAITQSKVPVAVYVTPAGARAASAGFFLLLAADVAAMAPGTNTGAAYPVAIGRAPDGEPDDPAGEKAAEDVAAFARALAAARGRPLEAADAAVREARSFAAEEAHERRLIDLVARDRSALLDQLEGRTIRRFDGSDHTLSVAGAPVVLDGPTIAERVLGVVGDPQIAYLLLLAGFLGIMLELMSPGAIGPGIAGAVCLLLAFYGLSVLPVSGVGLALIVVGFALLAAEAFVTSYGALTLAGLGCLVLGSVMLIDTPIPEFRIGLELILPAAAVLALATGLLLSRAVRGRRSGAKVGLEALIGQVGEVLKPIEVGRGGGKVFVHGETWDAVASNALPAGASVRIVDVEGRRLRVAPSDVAPEGGRSAL